MSITEERLNSLENEITDLRLSLERFITSTRHSLSRPVKDRTRLLDLFGTWDGDIDVFLNELYERRERRGRLE